MDLQPTHRDKWDTKMENLFDLCIKANQLYSTTTGEMSAGIKKNLYLRQTKINNIAKWRILNFE